jgi:recombination protein RecA
MFNEGISRTGSVIDMGVFYEIIDKKGAWFSYNGARLGQGREAVKLELKNNPQLLEEIEKQIFERCPTFNTGSQEEKPAQAISVEEKELAGV